MRSRHLFGAGCCAAMTLLALPAHAGGAGSEEWTSLDREIEGLARRAQEPASAPGLRFGAVLRANYAWFDESPDASVEDYSGFALDNVRPRMDGTVGDFDFQIELEAQSQTALLLDAYATWNVTEWFDLTLGQYQPINLRSALVEPEDLLFVLRTAPGQFFQERDQGLQVGGTAGPFLLRASLENGVDGAGDEQCYTLRADWSVLGGGVRYVEGSYGSGSQACLSVGASYGDDQAATDDGDVIVVDAALTYGRFAVSGEWLQFGDDAVVYATFADTSPWALMASFMLDPEKYEVALRYESLDDVNEVEAWTLGLNRYVAGHDVKWVLNVADASSDLASQDGLAVAIGLTVNV